MKKIDMNNQGFSLVEIMIIMAIGVILVGAMSIGISMLSNRPVDECARKIEIALEGNRNTTMGKLTASIAFYLDAKGNVMVKETIDGNETVKQIGSNEVTVRYITESGTAVPLTTTDTDCVISFDRANGSLKPLANGNIVKSFEVSRGDKKITVIIDKLTGRVGLE